MTEDFFKTITGKNLLSSVDKHLNIFSEMNKTLRDIASELSKQNELKQKEIEILQKKLEVEHEKMMDRDLELH